jgi:2-polyprenyl-6-methoxyphenol hydroxylase-like FAD-dependent oxidoreductase
MKEIAVIGGGIAGLTFALCMQDKGFDCQIFEKQPDFSQAGAAISIFPNALRVYKHLGILEEILANSGELKNIFLKTDKGKILAKSSPNYDLPTVCMHRGDLHKVLLRNLNSPIHSDHELRKIKTTATGKLEISYTNGKIKSFDAVVGADGIHSSVRKYVVGDSPPIYRGYNAWRGVCEIDFEMGYGSETYGKGMRAGIVPIKDGKYGWWTTCNEPFLASDEPEGAKAKLLRLFGNWHHPLPQLIANTDVILKNALSDRIPKRGWSKEKMVLLGDAAHPTTPNLGQGGCMAIEGAFLLAACIQKYGLTAKAFDRYEEIHFPRAKSIVETSLMMGKIGQIENNVLIGLRNSILSITPSSLSMKMVDKFFNYKVTEIKI